MSEIKKFIDHIFNGDIEKIKLKLYIYKNIINKIIINSKSNELFPEDIIENIFTFLDKKIYNKILNNKTSDSCHPLIAVLTLLEEKETENKGRKIINLLLSFNNINVSFCVIRPLWGNGFEKHTLFHMIGECDDIPKDICELILNHKSMNLDTLNLINHDDYRPLDLADHYNKGIVELLESKGALRHWRVGPGDKPKEKVA